MRRVSTPRRLPMRRTFPSVSDEQPSNIDRIFVTWLVSMSGTVVSDEQAENIDRMSVAGLVSMTGAVVSDEQA